MKMWHKNFVLMAAALLGTIPVLGCPNAKTYLGWTYSLGSYEEGNSIHQTEDGAYLVVGKGRAKGDTTSEPQVFAAKLSATGDVQWWRLIDDLYPRSAYSHRSVGVALSDGTIVLAGFNAPYVQDHSNMRLRLVALDVQGTSVWDTTYGSSTLVPKAVTASGEDSVVVAGLQLGSYKTFALKTDSNGDVTWEHYYDAPSWGGMAPYDMISLTSDGYVVVGGVGGAQALRIDGEGNQLWWNHYGEGWAGADAVAEAQNGDIVAVGTSSASGVDVPAVFRFDADGNLLWAAENIIDRAASTHYTVKDSLVDEEGRIVLVGEAEKVEYIGNFFPIITDEAYIMQLDANASLNWYKSLGSGYVNGVALTDSGDYITAGTTGSHLQVIRIDTHGNVR